MATDILRPVYDRTRGADGFVSLEVSPKLARDTAGTIREAQSPVERGPAAELDDQGSVHARRNSGG